MGETPFGKRTMNIINTVRRMSDDKSYRHFYAYAPNWHLHRRFLPLHYMVPPGYRPGTEFPDWRHEEYGRWADFPEMRNTNPLTNSPDMLTKFASDRARKMEIMKQSITASNFRVKIRAKYETKYGANFSANKSHNAGGSKGGAGPSALWSFWSGTGDGEVFARAGGPGTFPRPHDRAD